LILIKKEKLTEIEKIIIIHTQERVKRREYYLTQYIKGKKQEKLINKNHL